MSSSSISELDTGLQDLIIVFSTSILLLSYFIPPHPIFLNRSCLNRLSILVEEYDLMILSMFSGRVAPTLATQSMMKLVTSTRFTRSPRGSSIPSQCAWSGTEWWHTCQACLKRLKSLRQQESAARAECSSPIVHTCSLTCTERYISDKVIMVPSHHPLPVPRVATHALP